VLNRTGFYIALALYVILTNFGVNQLLVFSVFGCYALTYFAYSPKIELHKFGKFGDFSYGMYIYAFPVQQMIVKYLGVMNTAANFIIVFLITLFFAVMSWKFVENPALQLKSKGNANIAKFEGHIALVLKQALCRIRRFFRK
jgi:peptidoglycan/LPS O-acetylase OafA/YrhL